MSAVIDDYIATAKAFVASKYGSDENGQRAAFAVYASDDGKIGQSGIIRFLADAGIGWATFGRFLDARAVIAKLDTDGDGEISWDELQAGINGNITALKIPGRECIAAITQANGYSCYPWYVSINLETDGNVSIHIRDAEKMTDGNPSSTTVSVTLLPQEWDCLRSEIEANKSPVDLDADAGDVDPVEFENMKALRQWKAESGITVARLKDKGLDGAARVIQGILDTLTV